MSLFQLQKDVSRARKHIGKRKDGTKHAGPATAKSLRTRAFSQSISYRIPGTLPLVRQPSEKTCWAAATTMMMSWLLGESMGIDQTIGRIGPDWLAKFTRGEPLPGSEKSSFLNTTGMVSKGPANFSVDEWLGMLQAHGPLWVTTGEIPDKPWSTHARILVGISGDGTPAGTFFHFLNPARAGEQTETFGAFVTKYERPSADERVKRVGPQVVHWAPNAKATVYQQSLRSQALVDPVTAWTAVGAIAAVGGTLVAGANTPIGDITYKLDRMDEVRCPKTATAKEKAVQRASASAVVEEYSTCYALKVGGGVMIRWEYNGTCIGPILMDAQSPTDYLGGSAQISGSILLSEQAPAKPGPGGKPIIGVRISFHYSFACSGFNPEIRRFEVIVYADGTHTRGATTI